MSFFQVSDRLAESISKELSYSDEKKEIIAYGIESVILSVLGLGAIIVLAVPLKILFPTLVAAVFGGALRKVSGGAHFSTPFKCLIFGAVVYSLIGLCSKIIIEHNLYNISISLLIICICLVLVMILAPVDCEAKPIHSRSFRNKLKVVSVCLVILTIFVVLFSKNTLLNISAVLGIVYQTITLLPVFNKKEKEV